MYRRALKCVSFNDVLYGSDGRVNIEPEILLFYWMFSKRKTSFLRQVSVVTDFWLEQNHITFVISTTCSKQAKLCLKH